MQPKHAFTLIELLVVMTIIAVLAGLLLPVINMVRGSARQMSCMSSLRQIGFGMHGFGEEWQGRVPPLDDQGGGTRVIWMQAIAPYIEAGDKDTDGDGYNNQITRKNVIKGCPEYKAPGGNPHHGYAMSIYLDKPYSSCSNSRFSDGAPKWGGCFRNFFFEKLTHASSRLLVSERNGDNNLWDEGTITYRHGGRANALFCDLHVESVTKETARLAMRDPIKRQ